MYDLATLVLVLSVLTLLQLPSRALAAEGISPFVRCMTETKSESECLSRYGRYAWDPVAAEQCQALKSELEGMAKRRLQLSWQKLFFNERCHRLGHAHFEAQTSDDR